MIESSGEWEHAFTLNGYCVLCGAFNNYQECEPESIPDYEAGRH